MYTRNCEVKKDIDVPHGMSRIAMGVEYFGAGYNGFQRQKSAPKTIQSELEQAISSVANENITLVCAGRTDAGVHASGQVIHFDTVSSRPDIGWLRGVNTKLSPDVRVHWVKDVGFEFHARFSANSRTYRYFLGVGETFSSIMASRITWCKFALDVEKMHEAAQSLKGEHDFSSFRASQCQAASPIRHIWDIQVVESGPMLMLEVTANAFLHHMVRNIVGALIEVGRGGKPVGWLKDLLLIKDRTQAAPTAKPDGLYLVNVSYPDEMNLPQEALGPYFFHEK